MPSAPPQNTPHVSSAPFPWPPASPGTSTKSMRRCNSGRTASRRRWPRLRKLSMTPCAIWPRFNPIRRRWEASSSTTSPPSAKSSKSSSPPARKIPFPPRSGRPPIFCSSILSSLFFLCALCAPIAAPSVLNLLTPSHGGTAHKKVREYPPHENVLHRSRAQNFSISHARLVSRAATRPALAPQSRPLSHLGRRSNAATNQHRRGDALLPPLPRVFPHA